MSDILEPAGYIDSWCTKCRMMLGHTIVALVNGVPKRVECNTCGGQHNFRPGPPGSKKSAKKAPAVARSQKLTKAQQEFQKKTAGMDFTQAARYNVKASFEAGTLIDHKLFGVGLVLTALPGSKIKVLFDQGQKLLIHDRG